MSEDTFRVPEIIAKKRDGKELTKNEIDYFVKGVVEKTVQDLQLGAMLMAMFQKGLSDAEATFLTRAMMQSGKVMSWPEDWKKVVVDKHSTGGVGDKISLILAPALAACGLKVPMVSGRGLEHTGGTLDKLESIPGFNVYANQDKMNRILEETGCFIVGQTEDVVPADKYMYAARDVTATVNSQGLIVGSIISKKAAEGLFALVLDVKCGKGAFLKTKEEARSLAEKMVSTAKGLNVITTALVTDMNAPLGRMIGNSLEVAESIQCLNFDGPPDVMELVFNLGGELLSLAGKVSNSEEGCQRIEKCIKDGSAMNKFRDMMVSQGVERENAEALCKKSSDWKSILPTAKHVTPVCSEMSGTVHEIDPMACADVSVKLGAGRTKVGESINLGVGLELKVHIGTVVKQGDALVDVHHDSETLNQIMVEQLQKAFVIKPDPFPGRRMVLDVIQ